MKPMPVDYYAEFDVEDQEQGSSSMAMDLDDVEELAIFGDAIYSGLEHSRIAYKDFFNSFQDDFDDSDIN